MMKTKTRIRAVFRTAAGIVLLLAMASALFACKPTDFFTEVIITPFSDVVDYNNPERTVVNSPDALEESAEMTALDWTDESPRSLNVENLVTYSEAPTSDLTAHHSIFDVSFRFAGIEASDAVRLVFENTSELDQTSETDELDIPDLLALSISVGGDESQDDSEVAPSDAAMDGTGSGEDTSGEDAGGADEAGEDPDGSATDPSAPGGGAGPGDTQGPEEDPSGGYNGEVSVYNPGDGFARVNRVEHLAVLGNDVAVMAQSLGGAGAICATSEYAYFGLDASGLRSTTYASFADVFSGEMPEGFEQSGLLWSEGGSSPTNVKDIDAIITACGQRGVIVYDQKMGTAQSLFDLGQRRSLQRAEIQLVPVDMSTVQGMLDAAQVIGEALSESSECAQDASAMSRDYMRTVNNIVRSVAATNGGYLAQMNAAGNSGIQTAYNSPPVTNYRYTRTFGYIATDSEAGLSFTGSSQVDASEVVLFGNNNTWISTPLSFWMQTAGVWDGSSINPSSPYTGLTLLWPLSPLANTTTLGGGQSGGALSRWLGTSNADGSQGPRTRMLGEVKTSGNVILTSYGLGSSQVPYLIVCASDERSAAQVKDAVVSSMVSFDYGGPLTPYSVLPYYSGGDLPWASVGGENFSSSIGITHATTYQSPFYQAGTPLAVDDVVRENPTGLLGNWAEGNMESVLEAVWLADIYSASPSGCAYIPITSMRNFSVSIGGVTCTTTRDVVLQFYQTFYRCDASGAYNLIVTDEGL